MIKLRIILQKWLTKIWNFLERVKIILNYILELIKIIYFKLQEFQIMLKKNHESFYKKCAFYAISCYIIITNWIYLFIVFFNNTKLILPSYINNTVTKVDLFFFALLFYLITWIIIKKTFFFNQVLLFWELKIKSLVKYISWFIVGFQHNIFLILIGHYFYNKKYYYDKDIDTILYDLIAIQMYYMHIFIYTFSIYIFGFLIIGLIFLKMIYWFSLIIQKLNVFKLYLKIEIIKKFSPDTDLSKIMAESTSLKITREIELSYLSTYDIFKFILSLFTDGKIIARILDFFREIFGIYLPTSNVGNFLTNLLNLNLPYEDLLIGWLMIIIFSITFVFWNIFCGWITLTIYWYILKRIWKILSKFLKYIGHNIREWVE